MRSYPIARYEGEMPHLSGRIFDPETEAFCIGREYAAVDHFVWDEGGYCPETRAYAASAQDGLIILMCAKEDTIIAQETKFCGSVCRDSCLEFFVNPCPSANENYINFEFNAGGVGHIGLGSGRHERRHLKQLPEGMNVSASLHNGAWWAVCYKIPYALMQELCGAPMEQDFCGNFYCCDETIHPHFGTWNRVIAEKPDFHRPECFGKLHLEDA